MLNKTMLIFAFTLAISAAVASPAAAPTTNAARGTTIPLRRRTSLTQANGVFDKDKGIAATVNTINKHRQNLQNLQKNKGAGALKPVRLWSASVYVAFRSSQDFFG
jgi:cathepsin D